MEITMMNTKLPVHPFAQITTTDIEQVNGGLSSGDFKFVTMKQPEDGVGSVSKLSDETGTGPIFTTLAVGEEGGGLPELF
jgi:hypothetical protein